MIRNILPYIILLSSFSTSSYGEDVKPAAQLNLEVLDGLCVQNFEDFSNIEHMAKAFGGKPVLPSITNADPVMRNMNGKSFYIPYGGSQFIVGYAKGGGCTVMTRNIDQVKLAALITKNYSAKLVHTEKSGAQVSSIFLVTGNSLHKGSIFSLVYGKKATGFTEGSVGFIPANIVNSARRK